MDKEERRTEPEIEETERVEMTLQEAGARLGISRQRLGDLIRDGVLRSRLELTDRGIARRLVQSADVERLLREREELAATRKGKGRPVKLPKSGA